MAQHPGYFSRSMSIGSSNEPSPYHSRDQSPLPALDSPTEGEDPFDHPIPRSLSAKDLAAIADPSYLNPLEMPDYDSGARKTSAPPTSPGTTSFPAAVMSTALKKLTLSGVRRSQSDQSLALHQNSPGDARAKAENRRNSDPSSNVQIEDEKSDDASSMASTVASGKAPSAEALLPAGILQENLGIDALLNVHSSLKTLFSRGHMAADPWVTPFLLSFFSFSLPLGFFLLTFLLLLLIPQSTKLSYSPTLGEKQTERHRASSVLSGSDYQDDPRAAPGSKIESLQKQILLLSNELMFESFMKQQHLQHIRRLQRDTVEYGVQQINHETSVL